MDHFITQHVNELLTVIAARCETRAADLHKIADPKPNGILGRLHPDHTVSAKAERFSALGAQFKELVGVTDAAELLARFEGEAFEAEVTKEAPPKLAYRIEQSSVPMGIGGQTAPTIDIVGNGTGAVVPPAALIATDQFVDGPTAA